MVNAMSWLLYAQGIDPVPIVQEAGWGQKTLPPLAFDPPPIQPVSFCCIVCSVLVHSHERRELK